MHSDITAVIPTVGEASLASTIEHLLSGTVSPDRILVCIPGGYEDRVDRIAGIDPRIEILVSPERGQVAQRAFGFSRSKTKFTLQLDSDTEIDTHCLERLLQAVRSTPCTVATPLIFDKKHGASASYLIPESLPLFAPFRWMFYFLLNGRKGFESGVITDAGLNLGIDIKQLPETIDWFPGACGLHWTNCLVTENFYLFSGKAYAEDLFHSTLLTDSGVSIRVVAEARVATSFDNLSMMAKIKEQWIANRARLKFIQTRRLSTTRYLCAMMILLTGLACRKVFMK